jgi:hypothetical protein
VPAGTAFCLGGGKPRGAATAQEAKNNIRNGTFLPTDFGDCFFVQDRLLLCFQQQTAVS